MGLEHEQFSYNKATGAPLPYHGEDAAPGIKELLDYLHRKRGWSGQKFEGTHVIALSKGKQSVTIEPAGQVELSGAPHSTFLDMKNEHQAFSNDLHAAGEALGIGYLSAGVHPEWTRDDMHWMPKARYKIMRAYMPKRGNLGIDMMSRTCGSQINLDFSDEHDMMRKFRVCVALQPFIIALFARSNRLEGKESGYASYRAHIWEDTDPDRTGVLPFIFENGMSFERYVDYALDVPMYFIERDGALLDMSGKSFRSYMAGALPESKTHPATLKDWEDHLSTIFPEVRLKKFLELRGTDSVAAPLLYGLAAFWVGLLYDSAALEDAEALIQNWSTADHIEFRRNVSKYGLDTTVPSAAQNIADFVPRIIDLAQKGLESQPSQHEALAYLDPLYPRNMKRAIA